MSKPCGSLGENKVRSSNGRTSKAALAFGGLALAAVLILGTAGLTAAHAGEGAGLDQLFGGLGSADEIEGDGDVSLGVPTMSASHVPPMEAAIKRYADIVAKGGWQPIPAEKLEGGSSGPAVALLRKRLEAEGDLESGGYSSESFDGYVGEALRRFQFRYGMKQTGNLLDKDLTKNGSRTLTALNVPAAARLQQLRINLQRIKQQMKALPKRYVLVNLPAQQVEAVSDGRVVLRLNGVVGRPERPSPLVNSAIYELNFNPVWTLPPTVVKEDLIKNGQKLQAKGVDILAKFKIDAFGGSGKLDSSKINWKSSSVLGYRYSQQPSKDNPLGFVKLNFASPQSVYMHDTPSKKLFEKAYRAASSGCIRVQNIQALAAWLLEETPGWSEDRVQQMRESGERLNVKLKKAVKLNWVYVTAWANPDGTVFFRRDIYGKDQALGVHKLASAY